jgi:translocation and assembly module TamB
VSAPGRLRRVLTGFAGCLGVTALFTTSLLGGALLHLDTEPARAVTMRLVNDALSSLFQGRVVLENIAALGLDGVTVGSAVVLDPNGAQVIRASGIHVEVDVLRLAKAALLDEAELVVRIPLVRVEHAEVLVESGADGVPTLAATFTPPEKPPSTEPSTPSAPSRPVYVVLTRTEIGSAWIHGAVAPPRELDADVKNLVGTLTVTPDGVAIDVSRTGLTDRGLLGLPTTGTATYHLRVREKARMWSAFAGQIGDLRVLARGDLDDGVLDARLEVPRASPAELETLLPGLALREPLAARIDLAGELSRLDVSARIAVRDLDSEPSVELRGGLDTSDGLRADLAFVTRLVDPSLLSVDLPATSLSAEGRVRASLDGSRVRALLEARSEPLVAFGQPFPAAELELLVDGARVWGALSLAEQGMPTTASFAFERTDEIAFEARAEVPSIGAAPRLPRGLAGSASVRVAGKLRGSQVDARVNGSVRDLDVGGDVRLAHGAVTGRVTGELAEPHIDAKVEGEDFFTQALAFSHVQLRAIGPALHPNVEARLDDSITETTIHAKARLSVPELSARDLEAEIERSGAKASFRASRVGREGGRVLAEGLRVRGDTLGGLEGSLAVEDGELVGKLHGDDVALGELAKLVGLPYSIDGLASFDIALERTRGGRRGHVQLQVEGGKLILVRGLSASLNATFDDDRVQADALLRLVGEEATGGACSGEMAKVHLQGAEGTLVGPLLSARTFAEASGSFTVSALDWNLHCLAGLVPLLPMSQVKGFVSARASVERPRGQRFATVHDATVWTRDVDLAGPLGDDGKPTWDSRQMNALVRGSLDGATGETQLELALHDGYDPVRVALRSRLDLATLVDDPKRRVASLAASPLAGTALLPTRNFSSFLLWPSPVRALVPRWLGALDAGATLDGTLGKPGVALSVRGHGVVPESETLKAPGGAPLASEYALPIDVDATVTYVGTRADLLAQVAHAGREIASISGLAAFRFADLWERAEKAPLPWQADLWGTFAGLPLGHIPALEQGEVRGELAGSFALRGLNEKPRLSLDVSARELTIGEDLSFRTARLRTSIDPDEDDDGALHDTAKVQLEVVDARGGRLDATAFGGITWTDRIVPTLETARPARLFAQASRFRLATALPLVSPVLSRLDGDLQGYVTVDWDDLGKQTKPAMRGELLLENGIVHIPQLGQELREVRAHASYNPKHGYVYVDTLTAKAQSGAIVASGGAMFDGLEFQGAGGELEVRPGSEVPLTLEGVPLGRARGKLVLLAERDDRLIRIGVTAQNLAIDLPSFAGRSVQPLDPHPDVFTSHPLGPLKQGRPEGALQWSITFEVDPATPAVVAGDGLTMAFITEADAPPRFDLTDQLRVSGAVRLTGGRVSVFGKGFEVDQGLVRLRPEDAGNPNVNVTAHWDAPSGHRVFVDYVGILRPITNEKLRLRSSPPLDDNAILALVLFGREPDPTGDRPVDDTEGAVGLASSELLNRLVGGIGPLQGLTTRFGTGEDGGVRTSLSYDIGDRFTAEASFEGTGAAQSTATDPSTAADAASGQRTEVSIDWRFDANWLLRATLGLGETQAGQTGSKTRSGLDLLWQYRY